jgi:hypothetical protein
MGFWIFITLCAAVFAFDIVNDSEFKEKLKNMEE